MPAPSQPAELVFTADYLRNIIAQYSDWQKCANVLNDRVKAWLDAQPTVYSPSGLGDEMKRWCADKGTYDTHTAKLVNVRPIKKDTAEGLLRELLERHRMPDGEMTEAELISRARKLLGDK